MLILRAATDILRVNIGTAADIRIKRNAIVADNAAPPAIRAVPDLGPMAAQTGTGNVSIVDTTSGFNSGDSVNVKECSIHNAHATQGTSIRMEVFDGTNTAILFTITLLAGERIELTESGAWLYYASNGILKGAINPVAYNQSSAAQGAGFATDTYLTGSFVLFPTAPKVGTRYKLKFDVSKTAAGTATPIITVRVGTAGTTSDAARHTLTFNAGTAAADVGCFEVEVVFRAVGASAVSQARASVIHSLSTTGLINTPGQVLQNTSASYDSTVSGLGIGVSVNGGASAAWTVQLVDAQVENV